MKRAWAAVAVAIAVLVIAWWRSGGDEPPAAVIAKGVERAPLENTGVASASITGRVARHDGSGIARATVTFTSTSARDDHPTFVTTDERGEWTATIPTGDYTAVAAADGFLPLVHEHVMVTGARLELVLATGGWTLTGSITDLGGGPVPDASIVAELGGASIATTSHRDGRFRLSLGEGGYLLSVEHEAYVSEVRSFWLDGNLVVDVALVPAGSIRGRVVTRAGGDVVPNAVVELAGGTYPHETLKTVTTDDEGRFVAKQIGPGAIELIAVARGVASGAPTYVDRGVGENNDDIIVRVDRAYAINGRVSSHGSALAGASVSAFSNVRQLHPRSRSDASGAFEIVGLLPGTYSVRAEGDGRISKTMDVELGDRDATVALELGDPEGVDVRGRVDPPRVASLDLDRQIATSDPGGAFVFHGVTPMKGALRAVTFDGDLGSVSVDVGTAPVTGIVIRLAKGATVSGTLVDDSGAPVASGHVIAEGVSGSRRAMANEIGAFKITGLAPGKWTVTPAFTEGIYDDLGTSLAIELLDAEDRRDLRLVVPSRKRTIVGRVLDTNGAPVGEAWVSLRSAHDLDLASAATKPDGSFTFEHRRAGIDYKVRATGPHGESSGKATVSSDAPVVITLAPNGGISGRVRRASIAVPAFDLDCGRTVHVVSSDGTFAVDHLTPAKYHCVATTIDGIGAGDVEVNGAIATLDIDIPIATAVAGTVVDMMTGAPLADVHVSMHDRIKTATSSDQTGHFVISKVPLAGTLDFAMRDSPYHGSTKFIAIEGQQVDLGTIRIPGPYGGDFGDLGVRCDRGRRVTYVEPHGPAERGGLRVGDEIDAIDGVPMAGVADDAVQAILLVGIAPGRTVKLGLARGVTISVTAVAQ